MKSAALKDIIREIRQSKSRFFSIFAIIALGAGFFAGLKATCPDMLATETAYYQDNNLMDLHLVSTYGFSDEDMDAICSTKGIRGIYPSYSKDVFVYNDQNANVIAKLMALPDHSTVPYADKTINLPVVLEGRLPEKADECVVEKHSQMHVTYDIGSKISFFTTDEEDPLEDTLERSEFTVVGVIMDPMYISYERGSTTIGSGSINTYVLIPEENFKLDVFTDVYLTLDSTKDIGAFDDKYSEYIDEGVSVFEALADVREPERLKEIKDEAYEEINDAKKEIEDGKQEIADAEQELLDAESELSDAYRDLLKGEKELKDGKTEYEDGLKEFNEKIADAEKELDDAAEKLNDGFTQYYEGLDDFKKGEKEFYDGLAENGMTIDEVKYAYSQISEEQIIQAQQAIPMLQETVAQLEEKAQTIPEILESDEYISAQIALKNATQVLLLKQTMDAYNTIEAARKELENAKEQLMDGLEEYEEGLEEFLSEKEKGQKELDDALKDIKKAEKEIKDGWAEYYDGQAEFEDAKIDADKEIADAKVKIADGEEDIAQAERDIAELKDTKWFIFTRDDNPGYSTFENDAYRIESVCKIFPVFFFLVAVLVCLTTMTRMVEEERTEMGTLKALGYSSATIASKFIVYSSLASIAGVVVGISVGNVVFPKVIYSAYEMMYKTPPLKLGTMPGLWIIIAIASLCCTTLAALMACMAELKSNPSVLMRPKAPKAGKRVFLERITFIWKRLKFIQKVTVRNLFRYKKRILMTIIGIAGCTALTLTGFGLYSSISIILDKQYSDIFHYDLIVAMDTDAGQTEEEKLYAELDKNEIAKQNMKVFMKSISYRGVGDISVLIPETTDGLEEMVALRDRKTGKKYELNNDGIIVTERFTELTGLKVGDEMTFSVDEDTITAKISAITENYAMHLIYLTKDTYEELTGHGIEWNTIFTVMSDTGKESQDKLASELLDYDAVLALSFVKDTRESFSDVVKNLNYVVILIIVCAALLAFVVLYNLTNINITERIREIATIKVLGFYDMEVSNYVFRENILLTLMGDVSGLILGIYLHKFVISVAQTDSVMFGRDLPWWCFVAAFIMTIVFAYLVNFMMYFRLKKISMVESLKSIE